MPKPPLTPDEAKLEKDIMETMQAGLKRWRPDLHYPESASDMQACVRALMVMFEIRRRPLPVSLQVPCHICEGLGYYISMCEPGKRTQTTCNHCNGKRVEPNYVGQ